MVKVLALSIALAAGLGAPTAFAAANFEREPASDDARHVAHWAVDSGDNLGAPFLIVDKVTAKVFVFHGDGRLLGAAPALLGLARGDDSVAGIGARKLSTILEHERTTPAGRFVATLERDLSGQEVLWVDYESGVSVHPVVLSNARELRAQRLLTLTPLDNRISYGCINVSAHFYRTVVSPAFRSGGIVYVLPETRPAGEIFGSYDTPAIPPVVPAAKPTSAAPTPAGPAPSPGRPPPGR